MKKTDWHSLFETQNREGDMTRRWIPCMRLTFVVVLPVAEQTSVVNVQFNIYRFLCSFLKLSNVMYGTFPASPCIMYNYIMLFQLCARRAFDAWESRISLWATSLLHISGIRTLNYESHYSPCYGFKCFFSSEFFLCVTLYCSWAKCHRSKLPVRNRGLYRIKSGNDCSISVSSLQPPALLMHPVGRDMFSRYESEIVILLRIKFPPSLVSVSCDTSWQNGIMNRGVFESKGSKCVTKIFARSKDLKSVLLKTQCICGCSVMSNDE